MKRPLKIKNKPLGIVNVDTSALRTPALIVTGVAIVAVSWWWIKSKIDKTKRNNALANSIDAGTPENTAQKLSTAMGGMFSWADKNAIFTIFSNIKTKREYEDVVSAYKKITSGNLLYDDLVGAVGKSEAQKLLDFIEQKPEKQGQLPAVDSSKEFAERLKKAIEYWDFVGNSTNVEGVFDNILGIGTKEIYQKTKTEYQKLTNKNLWDDLEAEYQMHGRAVWNLSISQKNKWNDYSGEKYIDILRKKVKNKFGEI